MKKTAFLCIIFCLLFGLNIVSYAAVADPITPQWENIGTISTNVVFNDGEGVASGIIASKYADEIRGTLKVYKQNSAGSWILVDMVYGTTTELYLQLTTYFDGESGVYYKAAYTVTAIKNGVSETVTKTAYRTCE